jgi:hypothetical protein
MAKKQGRERPEGSPAAPLISRGCYCVCRKVRIKRIKRTKSHERSGIAKKRLGFAISNFSDAGERWGKVGE